MTRARWGGAALGCAILVGGIGLRAQAPGADGVWFEDFETHPAGDDVVTTVRNGIVVIRDGLELRADGGVLIADRDAVPPLSRSSPGLPRRGATPPAARRAVDDGLMAARLAAFAHAAGVDSGAPALSPRQWSPSSWKSLYLEGDVVVRRDGRDLVRAARLHLSTVDDRLVVEDAELRLWLDSDAPQRVLVIRGERLVRQGRRITGRDVSVTTCTAGEPHVEVCSGEIEVIERGDDLEVRTAGSSLVIGGVSLLPLPNARFMAGEQTQTLVQGVSAGYSSNEGVRANIDLGGSLNALGGALHEQLTGRAAAEFRGDWRLGLGVIEERGAPVELELRYGAADVYSGRMLAYGLDDDGPDRREIRRRLDGSPIDARGRSLLHTENRVHLGENTRLDVTAFAASDPAVYSEFFRREYREDELPETSVLLRDARDNRLLIANARLNMSTFAYRDDRSLAPAFDEELPLLGYHWFSEPVATLWGDTDVLLTSSTGAGFLRRDYDRTAVEVDDDVFRLDQELVLATPFHLGPIGIRPFVAGRVTHYDETVGGRDDTRPAFAAGVRAATWMARTWTWRGDDGTGQALRHVISPAIVYRDQFHVGGEPGDYFQYDATDAIDERATVRFELLNRLQHRDGDRAPRDVVWLDLAQTLTPISSRDNRGHHLAELEYELILRPAPDAGPLPGLQLLVEGEHDWHASKQRTFNTGVRFGKVLGFHWHAGYRSDRTTDGAVIYGARTDLFGRWLLAGGSQYDLQRDETLNYGAQIVRVDHDWRLSLGVTFDEIDGDTRFFVNFEPTLGGLLAPRRTRYLSGSAWDADRIYQP